MNGPKYLTEISHFHCELAQEAIYQSDYDKAFTELDLALKIRATSVRASLLRAEALLATGDPQLAKEILLKIETQNPQYLNLAIPYLISAEEKIAAQNELNPLVLKEHHAASHQLSSQGIASLRLYLERYPSDDLFEIAFRYVLTIEGPQAAYDLAHNYIKLAPSLQGILKLLELHAIPASASNGAVSQIIPTEAQSKTTHLSSLNNAAIQREDAEAMCSFLNKLLRGMPRYICQECGFHAHLFYWQCPGCHSWETYVRRTGMRSASN